MSPRQPTDALGVSYRSTGTGPPNVLLMHGWAGSGAYFDETIADLDLDRVRAITLDLNDHGESGPMRGDWTLDAIDEAILAVADAAAIDACVMLGFSMAGKFAQHLAWTHPERVSGLILVAGTPAMAFPMPQQMLDDWYARAGDAERLKDLVRGFLTGPVNETALDRFARDAARIPRAALEGTLRATIDSDFSAELASLHVPTLAIAGGRDEFFSVEWLHGAIVDQIAGARLAIVDCGHEVPLERPRELAALIEAFVAGLGEP